MTTMTIINAMAGLLVLAEALRCLEHASPVKAGMTRKQYGMQTLGVLAWLAIASSAAIAVAGPLLSVAGPPICWGGIAMAIGQEPTLAEVLVMVGAAGVVVRDWLE